MINNPYLYSSAKVWRKLYSKCNGSELYVDFIKDSEKEFNLPEKDLYTITFEDFTIYIEFLDNLWNK